MRAVIPFKKSNAKSRLSPLFTEKERKEFALSMLRDVARTLESSECFSVIDILTTSLIDIEYGNIVLADNGLNEALNEYLVKMSSHSIDEPVLIIMADIPLVSVNNIRKLTASQSDVVIVPGRSGGTNAIFIRNSSSFHVDYYGASFLKHCKIASGSGLSYQVFDSFNLSTDIDEVDDLVEVLVHGKGDAADYLNRMGFCLSEMKGRVKVKRN